MCVQFRGGGGGGGAHYRGGCSVYHDACRRDILSTVEDVQYRGLYRDTCGEYNE